MKKREPAILKLVNAYNGLCVQLRKLIRDGQAPPGVAAPPDINREGLFDLDVDDEIWQDIGLEDCEGQVPRWLGDEDVRAGIRFLHQLRRCEEEEVRLRDERCGLQEWVQQEWSVLSEARRKAGVFPLDRVSDF